MARKHIRCCVKQIYHSKTSCCGWALFLNAAEGGVARARTGVSLVTPTIGDPPRCESHRALPARTNTPERHERRQSLIQIESVLLKRTEKLKSNSRKTPFLSPELLKCIVGNTSGL